MNIASAIIIAGGLLGSATLLQATSDQIEAREITASRLNIVDSAGQIRITLDANQKETKTSFPMSGLTLFDASGRRVAVLAHRSPPGVTGTQPMLVFYDPKGTKYQTAIYQTVGQSLIALRDSTNTNTITISATSKLMSLKMSRRSNGGVANDKIRSLVTLMAGDEMGLINLALRQVNLSGRLHRF